MSALGKLSARLHELYGVDDRRGAAMLLAVEEHEVLVAALEEAWFALGRHGNNMLTGQERAAWEQARDAVMAERAS